MDTGKIMCQGTPAELKTKYAPSHFIWYASQNDDNEKLLGGLCGREEAVSFNYDVDHYNVLINGNITDFLYENKDRITDYEIIKGSMDDVFLNITGKELK